MCDEDLRFALPPTTGIFPSVSHNNKTIFLITVDLCDYGTTASDRGRLKVCEITVEDLIQGAESAHQPTG
jgi:hypothetical protein